MKLKISIPGREQPFSTTIFQNLRKLIFTECPFPGTIIAKSLYSRLFFLDRRIHIIILFNPHQRKIRWIVRKWPRFLWISCVKKSKSAFLSLMNLHSHIALAALNIRVAILEIISWSAPHRWEVIVRSSIESPLTK